MNKLVYLGKAIYLNRIIMYKIRYDNMLPKYGEKAQLCFQDADVLENYITNNDFYKVIADDVKATTPTKIIETTVKSSIVPVSRSNVKLVL